MYSYSASAYDAPTATPLTIAVRRSQDMSQKDQRAFMDEFGWAHAHEERHVDTWHHWRTIQHDPARIAGYLEGLAAARREAL